MPKRQFDAIVGIDEVARCPVLGSLVIAGVAIADDFDLEKLRSIGVKDSKLLSRTHIMEIARKLYAMPKIMIKHRTISAKIISEDENLNTLEAKYATMIIKAFKENARVKHVYIDSCDRDGNTYKARLKRFLKLNENVTKYTIETKADENYLVVSAASIIAKYISDKELDLLRFDYDIGSGNPNDPKTLDFIIRAILDRKSYSFIRTNWITYQRLYQALTTFQSSDPRVQQVLFEFIQRLQAKGDFSEAKALQTKYIDLLSIGGKNNGNI